MAIFVVTRILAPFFVSNITPVPTSLLTPVFLLFLQPLSAQN